MRLPEIRTAPVADLEIPVELSRLYDLAYNLWWTWSVDAHQLFNRIDPARWAHYHNPVEILINVEPHRWEHLLLDDPFVASYHRVTSALDRYIASAETSWFRRTYPDFQAGPFAYFSTEFGWHESLGVYSGGLGVLSGDHIKSASDMGLPLVGVGLLYKRGYFQQTVDADGHQQHFYPDFDLRRLPVLPVCEPGGREFRIQVALPGRSLHLRIWKAQVGRVPVLLLDSDVRENDPADRPITSILYVRGREMRLCQEIVLGMGGARALRALDIHPSAWHMNEGHSAFLALERIRYRVEREKISFDEAMRRTLGNALFTTHTPVPAGNEVFDASLIRTYFADWAHACGVPMEQLLGLGRAWPDRDDGTFNLTALAIRTTSDVNGVSELHGKVASAMWKQLLPGREPKDLPIGSITNGVHTPTWIGPEIAELLREHLGADFLDRLLDPGFGEAILAIPDGELWAAHEAQKKRMSTLIRERLMAQFARHGRSPGELRQVRHLVDPGTLTIGFARRFATYKRADLLFKDVRRLLALADGAAGPVQVLFAGKAHPADRPGQDLIRRIFQISLAPESKGRIVFVESYDMRIARCLVQGVDVWLNTPRRPLEASGTSGMKVAVNGGLNVSVLDGWWCEGYDPSHGWVIGEPKEYADPAQQDREDAESLYRVLSEEVVSSFYRRDASTGLPTEWIGRMKQAIASLAPRFSTDRMVQGYTRKMYLPASGRQGWGAEIDEVGLWSP
jgi:glycogen phosphorylase